MTPLGSQFPGNEPFPTDNTEGGGWIEHDGKGMPVDGDAKVFVRFREAGERGPSLARFWGRCKPSCWSHTGVESGLDIIAYRVVKP